eukprot:PhM_4_TR10012/c1_g1_i6/m.34914
MNNNATNTVAVDILPITWDAGLIVISYCLSVMSSYSALRILQMRFSHAMVILASACLAVSGIWSMHFVGMAAYKIPTHVDYNIPWTIFSVIAAFACTSAALVRLNVKLTQVEASRGNDPLEEQNTLKGNIAALVNAPHAAIIMSAVLIALGVCTMHYTGMHAIRSDARAVMRWGVIIASVLIALFAATAALYFAFILPVTKHFAIVTAAVMGVAVCGMHYTGMYGMVYELPQGAETESTSMLTDVVPYIILLSCGLSSCAIAISSHQYRLKLRDAVVGAKELATCIARADFDSVKQGDQSDREKFAGFKEVIELKDAFMKMGLELNRIKSFLPQSMLAAALAEHNDDGDDDDDNDDLIGIDKDHLSLSEGTASIESSVATGTGTGYGTSSACVSSSGNKYRGGGSTRRLSGSSCASGMSIGRLKKISLCVFNIVGYHSFIEGCGQARLQSLIVRYLESITRHTKEQKGVIEAFHGDHVIVSFNAATNASQSTKRAAIAAYNACVDCTTAAPAPSTTPTPRVSVGIATGMALCATMGTDAVKRFHVIGKVFAQSQSVERRAASIISQRLEECQVASFANSVSGGGAAIKRNESEMVVMPFLVLCTELGLNEIRHEMWYQAVDLVKLDGLDGTMLLSIEGPKSMEADEWMYQLQEGEQSRNVFAAVNDAFASMRSGAAAAETRAFVEEAKTMLVKAPPPGMKASMLRARIAIENIEMGLQG